MSNNLNNFWDDCLEDDNIILNNFIKPKDQNYSTINSNKTKHRTAMTTSPHTLNQKNIKKKSVILNKNSQHFKSFKNLNNYQTNNNQKNILSRYSTLKSDKKGKRIINNYNKYKSNINNSRNLSKNKNKNNSSLTSMELKLKKSLSECTFNPKLISNIKNKNLKEKLINYSKFTMYERGQIFEMKKKEDNNKIYYEQYKKKNKKYPFRPIIHKCPSFKNVIFNESNYDSLNYFYSRMNSARENKIYKNKKMPFEMINYEEIYKNENNSINDNNLSFIYANKIKKKSNNSFIMTRILNEKETELCKQNLHNTLMNLQLNKNEY